METFGQRVERLRALDADEYAYHSDVKKALNEAVEIIEDLMGTLNIMSRNDEMFHRSQDGIGE